MRLGILLLIPALLAAQEGRISLEGLAHPTKRIAYAGFPSTRLEWAGDGSLVQTRFEQGKPSLWRVDPKTWAATPFFEAEKLKAALLSAGAQEKDLEGIFNRQPAWSADRGAIVVTVAEDLFHIDLKAAKATRLTKTEGSEDESTFSPDGARVAFLRGNDLYMVEVATSRESRLTTGGSETVFNGRLDWVYQEEVYGRGNFRAFWWSPDSRSLAYLSLDETQVPVFTLADDRTQPQQLHRARYPKVGDPNPLARLGVVDLQGRTTWMEDPHAGKETLITRVAWDPKGRLLAHLTDRTQTWLELRRFEGTTSRTLLKEEGRPWVNAERQHLPLFLKDGGFLWESDRTGHRHLYRYDAEGRLRNALTSGDWEVRDVHGVNEAKGLVFFDGTARGPLGRDSFSITLDGKRMTCLTEARGTHRVRWNKDFSAFLDTWSHLEQPAKQALFDGTGKQLRLIDENPSPKLKDLKLGRIRLQQVKTRDGFPMETMLILPPDFDPTKKYPVFQHIYGGPEAPQVNDAWSRELLWWHFLAQQGYVVWICDNRSASNKGIVSAAGIHKRMGTQELEDQLDGLKWLGEQGFADMDRVCIEGWSYGGYMSAYALTHSRAWKLGIVGAPGTSFRLYDSIYTERYMGLPSENKEGYDSTDLAAKAKDMHGRALIMHGLMDDNVHPQNTIQFIDALQKAGKDFDLKLYPGSDHGSAFGKPWQQWDILRARWEFISRYL